MAMQALNARNLDNSLKDSNMEDLHEKLGLEVKEFDNWLRSMGLLIGIELYPVCCNAMRLVKQNNKSILICHARLRRSGISAPSKPKTGTRKNLFHRTAISNKQIYKLLQGTKKSLIRSYCRTSNCRYTRSRSLVH